MKCRDDKLIDEIAAVIRSDLEASGAKTPTEIMLAARNSFMSLKPRIDFAIPQNGYGIDVKSRLARRSNLDKPEKN